MPQCEKPGLAGIRAISYPLDNAGFRSIGCSATEWWPLQKLGGAERPNNKPPRPSLAL
jgi:hypothetical protein